MIDSLDFPRLQSGSYRITSPETIDYNCIASAAHYDDNWWQPGLYWPIPSPPDDFSLSVLERVFASLGYVECTDGSLEVGFERSPCLVRVCSIPTPLANCRMAHGRASWERMSILSTPRQMMLQEAFTVKSWSS
jgi:hypothetical protein